MTTGLARTSVRARPSAFAGVFTVLTLSATVVTASVAILRTASGLPPGAAREQTTAMGAGFTVVTVYLSIFVIGQVMALSVAQRATENAVLRAVGAMPWQIRRMVATEALLTALPALPLGYGLGVLLAHVWQDGMTEHGLLPGGPRLTVGPLPALVAAAVLVVTSQLGGLLAAHRAARAHPADALGEASAPRRGVTAGRVLRGVAAVLACAGAGALTALTAAGPREDAGEHLPLVLLAYLVAVALAGPALVRGVTAAAGAVRWIVGDGAAGELARAGVRARAGRLSPAVTPVALVVAFTLVKLAALAAADDPPWVDLFATVLYAAFAACVAVNTLVMLTAARRREVALLWAVGAGAGQIVRMFLAEAVLVGVAGGGAGALVALVVGLSLGEVAGVSLGVLGGGVWLGVGAGVLGLVLPAVGLPLVGHLRRVGVRA
ncbi:FtsX-like permease family protein [Streptomyces cacaoi]|uniref:FtsX-like permease family protein n=1 Tax=Streptomyces cacaoi TaxID=1898 RepID=UPI00332B1F10